MVCRRPGLGPRLRCLYLTPMKPPDDPTLSGDRLIGGLFLRLLRRLGFEVELVSRLRTRCRTPEDLADIIALADAEVACLVGAERAAPEPAALVFTYHNNYRAPDLIGPRLAAALGLPYVLAESSRAPKRASGPWAAGHALAEAASDAARLILAPTADDLVMLQRLRPPGQALVHLKPFIDVADWPAPPRRPAAPGGPLRLVTVGMMRPGNKVDSYLALAAILTRLGQSDWTLDVAGDGEGRGVVEAAFARFGERVRLHGAIAERDRLGALLSATDAFVWPAVEEPIGMVFLEAQAHGLPCLAYAYRGVPDVVADGVSGHLFAPRDEQGFATRLSSLVDHRTAARDLGRSARQHFEAHHTLDRAIVAVAEAFKATALPLPR